MRSSKPRRDTPPARPVLCFGEVLWDSLPHGLFPGGAPINVAYHLTRLGVATLPVTAVGADFLGRDLRRRLAAWGMSARFVASLAGKPTGGVEVELDARGVPRFRIRERVAWDFIPLAPALRAVAGRSAAVVFGSLAQRSTHNRRRLARLLGWAKHAQRVFDVNLRPPFDAAGRVWELCRRADLIKLNDDELRRLLGAAAGGRSLEARARAFAKRTGCARLCVTAGERGAGLLWKGAWHWEAARRVRVRDTVGAGDAFLAALLQGWLAGQPPRTMLRRACRLAEFVATRDGAQPAYRISQRGQITPG